MNSIYKIVFNKATGTYQAVCEYARSQGKGAGSQGKGAGGQVGSVGSSRFDTLTGKVFAFSALALGVFLVTHPALAEITGTMPVSDQNNKNYCYFDTNSKSVICGSGETKSTVKGVVVLGDGAKAANYLGGVAIGENAKTDSLSSNSGQLNHANYRNPYSSFNEKGVVKGPVSRDGKAISSSGVAVGRNSYGQEAGVAIGDNARAISGQNRSFGVAIGTNALSSGGGVVIGGFAEAVGINSVAFGRQAVAKGGSAQAYGAASSAVGEKSLALGHSAESIGARSITIGGSLGRSTERYDGTTNTKTEAEDSIAIGPMARTTADARWAMALGVESRAEKAGSVALGSESVADRDRFTQPVVATHTATFTGGQVYTPISDAVIRDAEGLADQLNQHKEDIVATVKGNKGAVSVGNGKNTRQITNLAAGSEDTDAVNVAQLKSLAAMPMIFQADENGQVERKLGERLPVKGATNGGIITKADLATNGLTIEVKPNMAKGIKVDENGVGINVNQQGPLTVDDQGLSLKTDGEILEITGAEGNKKLSAKAPKFFADTGDATTKDNAVEFDGEKNKLGVVGGQTNVGGRQVQNGRNIETKIDKANNKIEVALKTDVTNLTSLQFADGKGIKIGDGETKATHNDMIAIGKGATVTEGSVGDIGLGLRKALGFNEQLSGMPTGNHNQYGAYYLTSQGLAVGNQAHSGKFATSLGGRAKAAGMYATAVGTNAYGGKEGAVALGAGSFATGASGVAIGREAVSTGKFAQALGSVSSATGEKSFAVGHSATASGNRGIAIGASSNENGTLYQQYDKDGRATTYGAQARGQDSIALGSGSVAEQTNTLAIGRGAQATVADGVALGALSVADRAAIVGATTSRTANATNQVYSPTQNEELSTAITAT
ncbi:hypothetical protein G5C01_06615, partial [Moraxella bovoculi]|uniref:ESPR-type extended signal peptide-containing protein n=1 Tax=Moraxella bovoculi TaxID=386891 RepID=UPI001C2D1476